jgi:hypothetical protein
MSKSEKNKTNPLDNVVKNVEKYSDMYDNVIVDGNEIKLESQLRKEIEQRKVPSWQVMKQVAQDKARKGDTRELNDLLNIERKMRKKTNTAQRREPNKAEPAPIIPLNFDGYSEFSKIQSKPDTTLKRLEAERKKTDPDFFKGLGIFFTKNF